MSSETPNGNKSNQNRFNLLIAAVTAQVGCLTLLVIIGAVLGGMALDARMSTKPWFTIGLLVASIPVSLILMFFIVRKAIAKLKTGNPQKTNEEEHIGKDS